MMKKTEIPILFTPDEKFMVQTCVAIMSMETSKDESTSYHYYFLLSKRIDKDCLKYLSILKDRLPSFTYSIKYFDTEEIDNQEVFTPHITSSTYYRLYAAAFFDFDKCIYLDGDIIVLRDLSPMFQFDLGNAYVAGVKSIVQMQGAERDVELIEKYKIPSMDQYIIAGHIVFNLNQIRDDHMVEQFDHNIKKSFPQQDQDVLNFCCYNRIRFLKLKYGMFNRWRYTDDLYKFPNMIYEKEEIEEAISEPCIIHFAGGIVKPWINIRTAYAKEWWKVARKLLPEDEYLDWREKAEELSNGRDWTNILQSVKKMKSDVYIFGCTWIGQLLLGWLKNSDVNVLGFVDNSKVVQGKTVEGVLVHDLYDIKKCNNVSFVISSQKAYREIYEQLMEYGVSEKNVYIYRHEKDDLYFQSLHPDFREYEYRDLMAKEIGVDAYAIELEELKKYDAIGNAKKIWR